jgi:hypothetical protein
MKVVLHIGVHKTGTTAIQRTLHHNSASLIERGYFYQPPGPGEHNHHLIADGLKVHAANETKEWASKALRALFEQAAAAGCHTCIVSSEMFVESPDIGLIRDILAGHSLQIIAYLRPPDEIVVSAYNETVRDSFKRWPRNLDERPFQYDPSYWNVLSGWLAVFGPSQLTLAPFDVSQWPQYDLVLDFLRMIGIEEIFLPYRDLTEADMNFSLPASLIEVVRMTNAMVRMSSDMQGLFVQGLYELCKQYPALYPNEVKLLMHDDLRHECYRLLKNRLPTYRPYFRVGFNEDFLHWPRPSFRERIVKALLRR